MLSSQGQTVAGAQSRQPSKVLSYADLRTRQEQLLLVDPVCDRLPSTQSSARACVSQDSGSVTSGSLGYRTPVPTCSTGHRSTNLGSPCPLVAPAVVLVLARSTLAAKGPAIAPDPELLQGLTAPAEPALLLSQADRGLHCSSTRVSGYAWHTQH